MELIKFQLASDLEVGLAVPHDDGVDLPAGYEKVRVVEPRSISVPVYPDFKMALPSQKYVRWVSEFNPDVIHIHTPLSLAWQTLVIAKREKIPVIISHHTHFTDPEALKALPGSQFLRERLLEPFQQGTNLVLKQLYGLADGILAPTDDTASELAELELSSVSVAGLGIDISPFARSRQKGKQLRHKLGLDKHQTVLFVGRLSGEKNVDLLIKSFAQVNQVLPATKLVLIGDGPARHSLEKLATDLKIMGAIEWLGKIPRSDLTSQGYYLLGDVFVTLSRFETFGLTTVEAMASGVPVLAVKARAHQEVVGRAGMLITGNDDEIIPKVAAKLESILSDPQALSDWSQKSLARAEQFSVQKTGKKITDYYQMIIKQKRNS